VTIAETPGAPAAPVAGWRLGHAKNVYSQSGEDGIQQAVFERIPKTGPDRWAVEFGAWDGKKFSNSCNLVMNHAWNAVFIEANPAKFDLLTRTYADNTRAHCLKAFVTFDGDSSLDALLAGTPAPPDFDLLSIDIDGNDYHIWESVRRYRPKVVVIEFNPSIPHNISFVQPRDMKVQQGSSLLALNELAKAKGYALVCVTELNAIFVRAEFFPAFDIVDNSLDSLHKDTQYLTQVFQLYDGTLVWHGCKRLLWHGVPIKDDRMQVLPPHLRFLVDPELPPEQQRLVREELPRYR
jgi:hypothetical protein